MYEKLPDVLEDKFWDTIDVVVPYTDEAEPFRKKPFHGSAANIQYVDTVVSVNVSHLTFIVCSLSERQSARMSEIKNGRLDLYGKV